MKTKTRIPLNALGGLGLTAWLLSSAMTLNAQDGPPQGGFSRTQMRRQLLERMREQLEITDDSEWKVDADAITKVMEARRAVVKFGGLGGPFGRPGGPLPMPAGGPFLIASQARAPT
jgi:hypothetical protein